MKSPLSPVLQAVGQGQRGVWIRHDVAVACGGDYNLAAVVSQIIYWMSPDASGRCRARAVVDGKPALARPYRSDFQVSWESELGMKIDVVRRVLRELTERGWITTVTRKFAGIPMLHVSVTEQLSKDIEASLFAVTEQVTPVLGENPSPVGPEPKSTWAGTQVDMGLDPSPCTELTDTEHYTPHIQKEENPPTPQPVDEAQDGRLPGLQPAAADSDQNPTSKGSCDWLSEFEEWWSGYPKKRGRQAAEKSWRSLRKRRVTVEELTVARDRYVAEVRAKGTDLEFVKHGSTFLAGAWLDFAPGQGDTESGTPSTKGYGFEKGHRMQGSRNYWAAVETAGDDKYHRVEATG